MRHLLVSCFILLSLTSCVTLRPEAGQHADDWLTQWGAPHATVERTDGSKVLTWEHKYFGSFYQTFVCRKSITVASDGQVIGYAEHDCGRWL